MKHIIIGTAGHIDHGKTTLIKALTGRNTDRWLEEQKRGITIDLGFTYFDLPNGDRAGIIDVPGHEKFIHNMVAGVVGMDLVLVVIAADEGIMPQTREHLDILQLLGIEKSILVLNKCDLVEEEWLELMEEEIKEELSGTFLEHAPVVKVSSVTKTGISELIQEIVRMTSEEVEEKDIHTIPRLPIDRSFSMTGFGTVVTGTLVSGTLAKDATLELYPSGKECKIRNIQVYGENQEECFAGQRVAINISNLKKNEIQRGCVLAPVDSMKNTTLLDVKLQVLDSSERIISNRTRLHLFTGTSEVLCRAVLLDLEEIGPGESGYAQLRLEEEIAVRRGDKFVVRFYSPMETIGGGTILEPNPRIKRRFRKEVIEELSRKEEGSSMDVAELHVKAQKDAMVTIQELAKLTALSVEEIQDDVEELQRSGQVLVFPMKKDTFVWHMDYALEAERLLLRELAAYEKRHPYRHGMKKAEIQTTYFKKIKPNVFGFVLELWEQQGKLKRVDEFLCTPEHEILRDAMFEKTAQALQKGVKEAGYDFVKYTEIPCGGCTAEIREDVLNILREEQLLIKISEDIYTWKPLMDEAVEKIKNMLQENPIVSISQVRDAFSTSRKCAKLILEYTDSVKLTRKTGAESEWTSYS